MRPYKRHLLTILSALLLWIVLAVVFSYGWLDRVENRLIDQAFRMRPEQPKVDAIITIDIDDPAIATVGRWPWNWDVHRLLFDFLDRHGIDFLFTVDLDFTKRPPYTISNNEAATLKKELSEGKGLLLLEVLNRKDPQSFIVQTALMKERVFFSSHAKIAEGGAQTSSHQAAGKAWDALIYYKENGSIAPSGLQAFLSAELIYPPLRELQENSKGVGVNGYRPDNDGVIRRYPILLQYGDRLYPSIALRAAMAMLGSEGLDIEKGRVVIKLKDRVYPIPVNRSGELRINWTGRYAASFVHIPLNLLSPFIVVQSLKESLRGADLSRTQDPMVLHERLIRHAEGLSIMRPEDARSRATIVFLAFLMEHYFTQGFEVEETLTIIGLDITNRDFLNLARQVYLNNHIAAAYRQDKRLYSLEEALRLTDIPPKEGESLRDSYEQLVHLLIRGGGSALLKPLYFEPSKILSLEGKDLKINPNFLRDKVVFYGLTATGLTSQNPSPYMDRHPMIDLPLQVVNTIVTGSFIVETPSYAALCLMGFYIAFVFLTVLRTTPVRGLFIIAALATIHLSISWLMLLQRGIILPVMQIIAALLFSCLLALFIRYIREYRERLRVRKIFSTMVSPEVLKIMEGRPNAIALTGELRDATVFSSDVSGFTTISEGVTAQELAQILNLYLTAMSNIIMSYDGYVDKYEGDAIKAVFGVPLPDRDHPWKACCAALLQQEELKVIQKMILLRYGVMITARMGINTGVVYAGNMGSEKRVQYTVMGKAVHIAEELEPANKLFDTWIAAGEETLERAREFIRFRPLGEFQTPDGSIIKANEVLGWDRDRFIQYWRGRTVPELLLEPYRKLSPLRVLASLGYYRGLMERLDNPLLAEMLSVFEGLSAETMEFMRMDATALYLNLLKRLSELQGRYGRGQGETFETTQTPEARLDEIGLLLKDLFDLAKERGEGEWASLEIDGLFKALESFRKRLNLRETTDEAGQLTDHIRQMLIDSRVLKDANLQRLQTEMLNIRLSIGEKGKALSERIIEKAEDFHLIICFLNEKRL